MKSYIIKNCDCYNLGACCTPNADRLYCKDITSCVLKWIVNKCKAEKDKGFVMSRYGCKVPVSEGWDLASEMLELLEIEEVDEM